MNRVLVRVEGLAVLLLSIYFYSTLDFSWLLFFVLLFIPDLSMLGYLRNNKVGAIIYNIFHSYSLPITMVFIGMLFVNTITLTIGIIWIAHIGLDRMIGYGLKYQTDFKDTHIQRI